MKNKKLKIFIEIENQELRKQLDHFKNIETSLKNNSIHKDSMNNILFLLVTYRQKESQMKQHPSNGPRMNFLSNKVQ